jgi:thymidylate synthase (FAD)
MGSFRYIDKSGFTYTTPDEISMFESAKEIYDSFMLVTNETRNALKDFLVQQGVSEKRANECANFVLPRATESTLTIGFTPEALLQFMHKRLCNRAQPEIKRLAIMMKEAVKEINPDFAAELVPHCQHLLWCPEGKKMTCGAYPTKDVVKELIKAAKNDVNNNEQ